MMLKKFVSMLLVLLVIVCSQAMPALASEGPRDEIIWLDELASEQIAPSEVIHAENGTLSRANASVGGEYASHVLYTVGNSFSLSVGDVVTFECTYSPAASSVDYGVYRSDGRFFSLNGRSGKLDGSIGISYAGTYSIAIRNNSSKSITVVGTVTY